MNTIIQFLITYSDAIVNFLAIAASIGGMILWSHRSLHKDMQEIRSDVKDANRRIDDTNKRIDGAYAIMMAMLTKKIE